MIHLINKTNTKEETYLPLISLKFIHYHPFLFFFFILSIDQWRYWLEKKKKKKPANAGDAGDTGLIPGSGRSPGGGNDNLL